MLMSQVIKDIKVQKLRTFLTVCGIFWGTVSIILLLAFGEGLRRQMNKNMHGMGESIGIIGGAKTSKPFEGMGKGRPINLVESDAELLRNTINGISMISPEYSMGDVEIKHGKNTYLASLSGVIPEYCIMRNIIPIQGSRFINQMDVQKKRRVVFLGDELTKELFRGDDAVGNYVMIRGAPFLVIGVMKKKIQNSDYNGRDYYRAVIPLSTYAAFYGQKYIDDIVYRIKEPGMSKQIEKEIYRWLGQKYHFDPSDKEALSVWDVTEFEKFFYYFFLGFEIFMAVVGSFTLIVGAINLSNIMNFIVEDRRKEIGIKMALGATTRYVLRQFLFETFVLIMLGGLLGFIFSYVIIATFPALGAEDYIGTPILSIPAGLVTIAILGAAGIWAGYPPAKRAAELNPVQAMKE
jgi:putative ABC transport system permease protein